MKCRKSVRKKVDQCRTCDNSRLVPHPELDIAGQVNIPCPDCSQITTAIRQKHLADPTVCPWCGGGLHGDSAPEVDEGVATQEIECTECNRSWCDVYRLSGMAAARA